MFGIFVFACFITLSASAGENYEEKKKYLNDNSSENDSLKFD